jgi:hypothetical protein
MGGEQGTALPSRSSGWLFGSGVKEMALTQEDLADGAGFGRKRDKKENGRGFHE